MLHSSAITKMADGGHVIMKVLDMRRPHFCALDSGGAPTMWLLPWRRPGHGEPDCPGLSDPSEAQGGLPSPGAEGLRRPVLRGRSAGAAPQPARRARPGALPRRRPLRVSLPRATMSDPAVNAQLDGIISDFEALKRSFEVEEVETPNSTPPRRVQTPLLRATVASSTQKFQNSEPAARHVDSLSQRSPKAALRRVELPGPKAEPVSRRTELSIDISSKQVENAGATGPARFGLKRAEVLGHKTPEPAPRRTEITLAKPQEPAHRRMETAACKAPEMPAGPAADAAPKRVEIQVPKPAERPASPIPPPTLENSEPTPISQLQSRLEPKGPPAAEGPPKSQEAPARRSPAGHTAPQLRNALNRAAAAAWAGRSPRWRLSSVPPPAALGAAWTHGAGRGSGSSCQRKSRVCARSLRGPDSCRSQGPHNGAAVPGAARPTARLCAAAGTEGAFRARGGPWAPPAPAPCSVDSPAQSPGFRRQPGPCHAPDVAVEPCPQLPSALSSLALPAPAPVKCGWIRGICGGHPQNWLLRLLLLITGVSLLFLDLGCHRAPRHPGVPELCFVAEQQYSLCQH
ncbi:Septin-9 [Galemys pyrenaicus]|uniref:Septin-9 n=1 Tax=Galemys pyrenaicus TaxID=202257 RepID=A0A8J5ZU22_GALPY|nr:Septin-9 [Galemys pyrenaicus]